MRLRVLSPVILLLVACSPGRPPTPAPGPDASGVAEAYHAWVLGQADAFLGAATELATAVEAGDRPKARALYAPSRMFFERIEPMAEALGEFDARIDAREGDVPPEQWRGYHRLEKLLWSTGSLKDGVETARTLVADAGLLRARLEGASVSVPAMVTGAVELLNEVSTSKVTGEEERYSHTDLWDFQANVEGAEQIWNLLSPGVAGVDPELVQTIDARFASLYQLLSAQRREGSFLPYPEVDPKDIKALAAAVDALAEALSSLGRLYPGV